MRKDYLLAFDQGTTSSRAIIFDSDGAVVSSESLYHKQIYDNPGWVAHNAAEIYKNIIEVAERAVSNTKLGSFGFENIAAIGITNQRETVVAWDADTGEPVYDAIVWQCKRSSEICERMRQEQMSDTIRQKTGLIIDPYFSASKIRWLLDEIPLVREKLNKNKLRVGTMDSYLIWRLTGGRKFVTDYTNASRTMLFNISTLDWDDELLKSFGIPREILPEVVPSSGMIGETWAFGPGIPIMGVAGDQHASLFGQACFAVGDVKNTYGTGCFILKNIGDKPLIPLESKSKLLTTIAWYIDDCPTYALEGSIFNAGAALNWLINDMKMVSDVGEINRILNSVSDTNGVYAVPAFAGLGAPHWDMYARGTICGMTLATNREHVVRAVAESIAYQSRDVLDYMNMESGIPAGKLSVDGGCSKSDAIMQFQADIQGIEVERPRVTETTCQGVAYMAGLAAGIWKSADDIRKRRSIDKVFRPSMPDEIRNKKYSEWLRAVGRAGDWVTQK